jgi:hypothetical protein
LDAVVRASGKRAASMIVILKGQVSPWPFIRYFVWRGRTVARQKFEIGQVVEHDTRSTPNSRPDRHYEVVRVLPSESETVGSRTYRIKSIFEPFERSAKEYEIVAVDLSLSVSHRAV